MDYTSIETPAACYADFCLIPVGTGKISVAEEVAEVQRVIKASGLKYTMHSAGTTVGTGCDYSNSTASLTRRAFCKRKQERERERKMMMMLEEEEKTRQIPKQNEN
ncbi:UPF0045 protein ECM15 [Beauveria bassiana]|nr:UPF0045 protein ECM15 [Beauveria bassiana]